MKIPEKSFSGKSLPSHSIVNRSLRRPKKTVLDSPRKDVGRRKSIFARKEDLYVEAGAAEVHPNALKTEEDTEKILAALNSHFIFTSLTDEDKEMVAGAMYLYTFEPEAFVFLQGMPSRSYYVIRTGSIEVIVNGKKVNKIREGDGFGELALLHDNPRSATLKCCEHTTLWGLDRETFKKVIEEMNIQIYNQNRAFLEKVNLLDHLTPEQKDSLAANMISHKYFSGQKIISEGEPGNQLYIIKEGVVSVMKGGEEIRKMYPGSYFGDSALINNTPRTATCIAIEGPVKCMCLSRETLQRTLNNQLQDIIERNTLSEAIKKSTRLSLLSKEQKEMLLKNVAEKAYKAGDVVIAMGTVCSAKLFFLMSGRLQYAKNTMLFSDKGTVVGDLYVTRSGNEEVKYQDDFIAGCDMKIAEITKYQFEMAIGGKFENVIKENAASNVLRKIQLFSGIEHTKLKELLSFIVIEKFSDTAIILREGVMISSVYVVKRGRVDEFRAGALIKTIGKLGYFGEKGLVSDESSVATYAANGHVTLWSVKLEELQRVANEKVRKQISQRIMMQEEEAELKQFVVLKFLGRGLYSRVYLVRTPKNNFYALKVSSRKKIKKLIMYEPLIVTTT